MSATRSEVRLYGSTKVVVLSSDFVSAAGWPMCAPIVRQTRIPGDLSVLCVPTHETDPVTGVVLLPELAPVDANALSEPIGSLVGATLSRIEDGICALFAIPGR